MITKAIVSLSGGMDSATVLGNAIWAGRDVSAVGFNYGSKHNYHELKAATHVAGYYGVPFEVLDFSKLAAGFKSNLMIGGGNIPEGHYEAENMSATVVPARNIIFASILAGVAWSTEASEIWLGVHSGDHAIYPDCRPEFIHAMNVAIRLGTDCRVTLLAPFLNGNKTSIIKWGNDHEVPYGLTRTCYKDQPVACGKCGSCNERREAFAANQIEDPIKYEYNGPLPAKPK